MASLLTGFGQLIVLVIVLSQLTASLPLLERTQRHADGVFHSELSKMNENAYVQQLVKSLMGLNQRYQRHADGMFTSELSKMRGNAQVQKLIKSLVGYKRSGPNIVKETAWKYESDSDYNDFCFMWLYQSFLNDSGSDSNAREAAQVTSQYICPASKQLTATKNDEESDFD
ncbi:PREDICTED: secretin [Crocodylus porosus]|uniref:secretin n=1 Tax=Crocodylus porosus TaxID=8502 RepID=UPI00093A8D1F|nr:PREDICTED: secretin [Crocodylus porosus]